MAIRVTYGDVADYARLGVMAGQARAATEAVERQAAMDRQVMQIQAQRASQERAQEHQKQMAEFDAFLDIQKYQRAEAFELEKMELRSRHDFEMVEAKREADFQYQLQREQARKQEMEAKLKALASKAPVEMGGDGFLSREQYEDAVIKVQTGVGVPQRTGVDFRKLEQDYQYYLDTVAQYKKGHDFKRGPGQRLGVGVLDKRGKVIREATPAEQQQLAYAEKRLAETQQQLSPQASRGEIQMKDQLKKILPSLNPESQVSLQKIIDEGNPEKMRAALNRIAWR